MATPQLSTPGLPAATERAEKRRSPGTRSKSRSEKYDGVDALTTFRRPVDICEIQPESELIEGERGSSTIENGEQATDEDSRWSIARACLSQPCVSDQEE